MAKGLTDSQHYTDIAAAIRAKKGTSETLTPGQMAAEIRGIESGSSFQSIVTDVIANHIVAGIKLNFTATLIEEEAE